MFGEQGFYNDLYAWAPKLSGGRCHWPWSNNMQEHSILFVIFVEITLTYKFSIWEDKGVRILINDDFEHLYICEYTPMAYCMQTKFWRMKRAVFLLAPFDVSSYPTFPLSVGVIRGIRGTGQKRIPQKWSSTFCLSKTYL